MERAALRPDCLAFSLFLAAPSVEANEGEPVSSPMGSERTAATIEKGERHAHLTPESSLADLLDHPAFVGHARLLLPWNYRAYDENMQISDIGSLLPYHTNIDPGVRPETTAGQASASNKLDPDHCNKEGENFHLDQNLKPKPYMKQVLLGENPGSALSGNQRRRSCKMRGSNMRANTPKTARCRSTITHWSVTSEFCSQQEELALPRYSPGNQSQRRRLQPDVDLRVLTRRTLRG